jgi:hypothetical protein
MNYPPTMRCLVRLMKNVCAVVSLLIRPVTADAYLSNGMPADRGEPVR